jgi:hypothetical protein
LIPSFVTFSVISKCRDVLFLPTQLTIVKEINSPIFPLQHHSAVQKRTSQQQIALSLRLDGPSLHYLPHSRTVLGSRMESSVPAKPYFSIEDRPEAEKKVCEKLNQVDGGSRVVRRISE